MIPWPLSFSFTPDISQSAWAFSFLFLKERSFWDPFETFTPLIFQTACFERTNCTQFTYFEGSKSRCVLFNSCSDPVSSCKVGQVGMIMIIMCIRDKDNDGAAWSEISPQLYLKDMIMTSTTTENDHFSHLFLELRQWPCLSQGGTLYGRASG